MSAYAEKLRDPRWQKRRLRILERDGWACRGCSDAESTLHVHHRWYEHGQEPWDATDAQLVTLCEHCHTDEGNLRRKVEADLLGALGRELFVGEMDGLACGFRDRLPEVSPEDLVVALSWMLRTPGAQQFLLDFRERTRRRAA